MNGATEATLQDLLAVAQAMNANMVGLNRLLSGRGGSSSGGGAGSTGGGLGGVAAAAGPASMALGGLRAATGLVSATFGLLGSIVGKTIGGLTATVSRLYDFAKMAAEGTAKLSDFYNSFRDLPFFIGNIMSLAADIIRYQEGLLDSYRRMSAYGATFGGSLSEMRRMAAQGFMSMEEFSRVIRENSVVFATLGGNVDAGARKFIETQSKLIGPGSKYSQQLLGLGYTTEQISALLTNVYNSQTNLNNLDIQNANKVAEAVANSARELDLFSRATGKNREQLEQQQKKLSLDTAFNTFTKGITDPAKREAIMAAVNKTISEAGEDAGDLIKQMFMTGGDVAIPLTEGGKQFMVAMGDQGENLLRQLYKSADISDPLERTKVQMGAFYDIFQMFRGNILTPLGNQGAMLSLMNNRTVNQLALMAGTNRTENLTRQQFIQATATASKNQEKAAMGTAGSLAQAQVNIKNFGAAIMDLVQELVGPIAGYLISFGNTMTKELYPIFQRVIGWFKNTFDELTTAYTKGSWSGMFLKAGEKIAEGGKIIWDKIGQPLLAVIRDMWDRMRPTMQSYFEMLMERMWVAVKEYFTGGPSKEIAKEQADLAKARERFTPGEGGAETFEQTAIYIMGMAKIKKLQEQINQREIDNELVRQRREQALIEQIDLQRQAANLPALVRTEKRHSGTLGMTGNWWERENKVVEVQAGETVATQAQLAQIVGAANQNGMSEAVSALNSSIKTLISVSQKIAENTAANVAATKRLDGNVFTMV